LSGARENASGKTFQRLSQERSMHPSNPAQAYLRPVSAPVATPTETADQGAERPLNVCIRPYDLDFAEYQGSRAQLEAEGVIPPDTKWPEGGASVSWEAGQLEYSLSRTRPEGMKGPQKLWLAGDWWSLRFQLKIRPNQGARAIQKKAAELAAELHRQSPEGQRQRSREWAACEDKAFQAFKTKFIPQRKKPGRPAKVRTADPAQGAQA
jgi:hypothetical protein